MEKSYVAQASILGIRRDRQQFGSEADSLPNGKRVRNGATAVLRPGLPPETPWTSFHVADRPCPPVRPDDKDGHYVFELGDNLSSRYKVLSKLGEGTFGRVLECWDRKHKEYVAIKVVRNIEKYRNAAMIELEVLNTIEHNDPTGARHCVCLREWFDYRDHVCMVFEKLGPSLFDVLRWNRYRPFPAAAVREFARQLLESVAFLHDLHLVHTDLKPENILLVGQEHADSAAASGSTRISTFGDAAGADGGGGGDGAPEVSTSIKVIDFGSATFDDQHHSTIVSTRHYRAPEVILGIGWSSPCDIWSVGCILVELATGDALFQTHENAEHLAMMERVLGPLPTALTTRCNDQAARLFTDTGRLRWPDTNTSRKSERSVAKMVRLRQMLDDRADITLKPHVAELEGLVAAMLAYEPSQRMTARQALRHPFFAATGATALLTSPPALPAASPPPAPLSVLASAAATAAAAALPPLPPPQQQLAYATGNVAGSYALPASVATLVHVPFSF